MTGTTQKPNLFISYRRSDAMEAVRALYFQLRLRFGSRQVFMDVSAITSGSIWAERLRGALHKASVVLVVIGPDWLRAADEFGRRRLDTPDDWVRLEIESALDAGKTVIPLLIGGLQALPPPNALPASLTRLHDHQAFFLNETNWESNVAALARLLVEICGFSEGSKDVIAPAPEVRIPELTEEELDAGLKALPGWEAVESAIPRDYPHTRHELRRAYRFDKFRLAIGFLQTLVEPINRLNHHPRIENQWRTVIIHFTTWDIGNKISNLDLEAAAEVDRLYEQRLRG